MALDPRSINSKITLKVKEGPGEIIGINDLNAFDGMVDFKGIQFSDPGKYIISVIPSSQDLKPTEFEINILPEEDIIPQEESRGEERKNEGSRNVITQIDKTTVTMDPIEFDTSSSEDLNLKIKTTQGFTPVFNYNGSLIPERDISYLEIYYHDYIPRATVIFKDSQGLVSAPGTTPTNNTKFEIFLSSGSKILKSIHLKFKIDINKQNPDGSIKIQGSLDIKDFYKESYKSYNGTSFEVLRKLSKESNLGFNSNISNTDDSMKWIRQTTATEFIKKIVPHSYISDETFLIAYVDYYWCLNYVDIEKEWKRDISNDLAENSTGFGHLNKGTQTDTSKVVRLQLTNDPSNNSSPFYFTNYKKSNNSTYLNNKKGLYTVSKVYDRVKKQFLKFNIDSQTNDTDKQDLKGAKYDTDDLETHYKTDYSGKIDTNNVHPNYNYAKSQNRRNLDEMVKIVMEMELPSPNFNLYKFQKINILFVNQKTTVTDEDLIDYRYSGDWMIIDIRYVWTNGGLKQVLKVSRKDLGKSQEELEKDVVGPPEEVNNSEINENPAPAVAPNLAYVVGEQYTLMGKDNRVYEIIIEKLSEDGKEVTAKLKEL